MNLLLLLAEQGSVFDGAMGGALRGAIIGGIGGAVVGIVIWVAKKMKGDDK
jgi:hypothetical protein